MVYAYKNINKELMRSSSGGAFIQICKAFAEGKKDKYKCYYCGAILTEKMNVEHQIVESVDQCFKFQGSKYVKSEIGSCYKDILELLRLGNAVLFSGTPCQVAGLKKYLGMHNAPTNNLFTIDIICHGAPLKKVWEDYKKWLEKQANSQLVDYSFRYKPEGWKAYPAFAVFEDGKKRINTSETSVYSRLHMRGLSVGKGCFTCAYAKAEREGDITLGDFWGIESIDPSIPYKNGVSLIIVNTKLGQKIIDILSDGITDAQLLKSVQGKEYLKYQHNLNSPTEKPTDYDAFWKDYERGFDFILYKYLNYGSQYKLIFGLKRLIRKTPIIEVYRKIKRS